MRNLFFAQHYKCFDWFKVFAQEDLDLGEKLLYIKFIFLNSPLMATSVLYGKYSTVGTFAPPMQNILNSRLLYNQNIWLRKNLANRPNLPIGKNLNWWPSYSWIM